MIVGHLSTATPEARLVVWGEVVAVAVQVVLSTATAFAEIDNATADNAGAVGEAAAVTTSNTRLHCAPSYNIKSMGKYLSGMHSRGTYDTVGKTGTPNNHHQTSLGLEMTGEGTSAPTAP